MEGMEGYEGMEPREQIDWSKIDPNEDIEAILERMDLADEDRYGEPTINMYSYKAAIEGEDPEKVETRGHRQYDEKEIKAKAATKDKNEGLTPEEVQLMEMLGDEVQERKQL